MRANLKDDQSINSLVQELDRRTLNPQIVQELIGKNSKIPSEIKNKAILKLKERPLFVLTGQQVGLYGGPLLTLYKAVTAIKAAKILSEKLKRNVIPVFWLQSEDHDLLEISSDVILNSSGEIKKLAVDQELAKSNRKSVGELKLTNQINDANLVLKESLSGILNSEEILSTIYSAYVPGASWSDAFLILFIELFKDTELLFFDLKSSELEALSEVREVFLKSVVEMEKIEKLLTKCAKVEEVVGGVTIKANSPLCFISDEKEDRFRLTLNAENKFSALPHSKLELGIEEILELVETSPRRFSTSALLRPIVQDSLFPTVAYIGGDAELKYHRQLDLIYPEFNLTPPLLIPRSKFRLLSRKTKQLVEDIGLPLNSYLKSNEELGKELRASGRSFGIDSDTYLSDVKTKIEKMSEGFYDLVKEIDPTLEDPLKKTTGTALNAYNQFITRLSKASIQKDSVTLNRIERVRAQVFPSGKEQERELGLISIIARTGKSFLTQIEEASGEFDGAIRELIVEEL